MVYIHFDKDLRRENYTFFFFKTSTEQLTYKGTITSPHLIEKVSAVEMLMSQ